MKEQFSNAAVDSLAATITSGATSLSVNDASAFPASGQFRILIDSEIMLVTGVSGSTFTVLRAQEGTSAAGHVAAAGVAQVVTAGALQRWARDNDPAFDGDRPPFRISDASGGLLTSADFTTVNLSTGEIIDDASGSITIRKASGQGDTENITALVRTAPATPNSVVAAVSTCWPTPNASSSIPNCGIGFRESSSGKLFFIALNNDSNSVNRESISIYKYTGPTSSATAPVARHGCTIRDRYVWLKAADDGTDLTFHVSHDGINWVQIYSEGRTAFMSGGPSEFMFGANNPNNSFDSLTTLEAWNEG